MHPVLGVLLSVWLVAFLIGLLRRKSNSPDPVRPAAPTGVWMLIVLATWAMMMIFLKRTAGYMSYRHVMFLAIALLPLAGQGLVLLVNCLRPALGRLAPTRRLCSSPLSSVRSWPPMPCTTPCTMASVPTRPPLPNWLLSPNPATVS